MDWSKLTNMLCPKCGWALEKRGGLWLCSDSNRCDFKIWDEKLQEIVVRMDLQDHD